MNTALKGIRETIFSVPIFSVQGKIYLGDSFVITVTLYDGYGRKKTTGGDHIRARLFNDELQAYTNGFVSDHDNGTYSMTFNALWTGHAKAEIELLYTMEVIAANVRVRKLWVND